MQEVRLEGNEAIQAIQCYTMLNAINNVITTRIEDYLTTGYTDEVAAQMSKETFTAMAIISSLEDLSSKLKKDFENLVGISTNAFKIKFETTPTIIITQLDKEEEKNISEGR